MGIIAQVEQLAQLFSDIAAERYVTLKLFGNHFAISSAVHHSTSWDDPCV